MQSTKYKANTKESPSYLTFPFVAVVGMPLTKRALMLLAVDPLLKGVVIAAASGTAKSVLGRAVAEFFASPTGKAPFIDVPLNVTEERLLGGLDIDYAFSTGKRRLDRGLISQANSGILYIDDIALLESRLANQLLSVMDDSRYQIERDGISAGIKTDFVVIGSFNPDEGGVTKRIAGSDRVDCIGAGDSKFRGENRVASAASAI